MYKILEWVSEAIGWLVIMASPLLVSAGIGALIYLGNPTTSRLVIGISITAAGLIIGVVWATKIWNTKKGTVWFLSKTMATPELDQSEKEPDDSNEY